MPEPPSLPQDMYLLCTYVHIMYGHSYCLHIVYIEL
jgi:hypothetical protein